MCICIRVWIYIYMYVADFRENSLASEKFSNICIAHIRMNKYADICIRMNEYARINNYTYMYVADSRGNARVSKFSPTRTYH